MHGPEIKFMLGGIPISETVVNSWIIMAILMTFAYVATRKLEKTPKGLQNFTEFLVDSIYGLVKSTMGENKMGFAPYIGTLFMFYLFCNLIGLFGFRSPTTDLNTTVSFALITFSLIHINAIRSKGLGNFLKGFLDPMPLMLPLNIIGELALPVSLSFRPFGNITGGTVIMGLLYSVLMYASTQVLNLPIPILGVGIPAVLHIYFDLLSGTIQAFIFTMLTMVFVSNAID